MDQASCESCVYYRQHYTFDQRKIFRVCCGHCSYLRPKRKRPDSKNCEHYSPATNKDAFVSKEFLSKELLEYIMKLELLPEIYDTDVLSKGKK